MNKHQDNRKSVTRIKGDAAEERVIEIFRSRGYSVLVRNYGIHNVGELDSVFVDKDTVYIVEVRARVASEGYPTPSESVTASKRRKIMKTARFLIRDYDLYDKNIYFLVGQVTLDRKGLVQNVEFIPF